jgi:hypothetical protein
MTKAEIDAIVAAYLIGDIGEALRLVALRRDRVHAELAACSDRHGASRRARARSSLLRNRARAAACLSQEALTKLVAAISPVAGRESPNTAPPRDTPQNHAPVANPKDGALGRS